MVHIVVFVGTTALGEWVCLRYELAEIDTSDVIRRFGSRGQQPAAGLPHTAEHTAIPVHTLETSSLLATASQSAPHSHSRDGHPRLLTSGGAITMRTATGAAEMPSPQGKHR